MSGFDLTEEFLRKQNRFDCKTNSDWDTITNSFLTFGVNVGAVPTALDTAKANKTISFPIICLSVSTVDSLM